MGKGAVVVVEREVTFGSDGRPLCTLRQTLLLRGDGGFGGQPPPPRASVIPDRDPDVVASFAVDPRAALIYRLSGDWNPLHADPEAAKRAGFERPILHGLASYAIAGVAVARALGRSPAELASLGCRFTGIVLPWRPPRLPHLAGRGGGCVSGFRRRAESARSGFCEIWRGAVKGDPALAGRLRARLKLPVMAGPMFIASTPDLVIAQCRAGIIGAMPALNARTADDLDAELSRIKEALADCPAPYAINLVCHRSNARLQADLDLVVKHEAPIVVLALGADPEVVSAIHAYGGLVFNDVASDRHARKCGEMGVDGIIAVSAGAGGHTGSVSPFALTAEIREWWRGPLLLAGCIATGRGVLAAETLGADFAYIGSPFLASREANTAEAFKQMVVKGGAADMIVTKAFTGARASFLAPSLRANGLDPDAIAQKRPRDESTFPAKPRTASRGATSGARGRGSARSRRRCPPPTGSPISPRTMPRRGTSWG